MTYRTAGTRRDAYCGVAKLGCIVNSGTIHRFRFQAATLASTPRASGQSHLVRANRDV